MKDVDNKVFRSLVLESLGVKNMNESVLSDGGYLVGSQVVNDIIDNVFIDQDYIAEASRYEVSSGKNNIKIPFTGDFLQPSPTSGTRAYWTSEAANLTASIPLVNAQTLNLDKITCLVNITDELLYDVSMADVKIKEYATKAAKRLIAYDTLFGVGAIQGVFNTQTATQQTALDSTPTADQLNVAYNLLNPALIDGAVWYVSQEVFTDLFNANYNNIDKTLGKLTILGLPVKVCPYLGGALSGKHIFLGNFKAFAYAYKTPTYDKSTTVNFLSNQNQLRLIMRFAGDVQTRNTWGNDGVLRSAFVTPTASDEETSSLSSDSSDKDD